jgi:hypothetical protein
MTRLKQHGASRDLLLPYTTYPTPPALVPHGVWRVQQQQQQQAAAAANAHAHAHAHAHAPAAGFAMGGMPSPAAAAAAATAAMAGGSGKEGGAKGGSGAGGSVVVRKVRGVAIHEQNLPTKNHHLPPLKRRHGKWHMKRKKYH